MCHFVRCKTQVSLCLEVEFKSSALGATYSAFVFIFISLSKINLMASNLTVAICICLPKHDVETVHGIWKHLDNVSEI